MRDRGQTDDAPAGGSGQCPFNDADDPHHLDLADDDRVDRVHDDRVDHDRVHNDDDGRAETAATTGAAPRHALR